METFNPILKYFFPVIVFLQYFGCDSYRDITTSNLNNNAALDVIENCSEFDKDAYNGFYIPSDTGKLFVKKGDDTIDSLYVSEKPLVNLHYFKSVSKGFDMAGYPNIRVVFNKMGTLLFKEYTAINIGTKLAIVVNGKLITAPLINSEIPGGTVEISGNFTQHEVNEMYIYLHRIIRCVKTIE